MVRERAVIDGINDTFFVAIHLAKLKLTSMIFLVVGAYRDGRFKYWERQ